MNSHRIKALALIFALVSFFIYANVTADTNRHQAEVTILPDGKLLPELIRDIAEAKQSIYIAMYMFKSYDNVNNGAGLIKASLVKAAKRSVKVYIALDSSKDGDFIEKENKKLGKYLLKNNIQVVYDSPDNRMHTKALVIDERISYIGSHNYTNSALKYNREMTVRIVSEEASRDAIRHIKSIK
ncbi:MAG: hypothetical protein C0603_13225 [Denitrovibrio sp.]|nr:MAG: hypothetical protein C0603_13225 [Denitrovibrio sp.]